jgi:hypothetical protein
VTGTGAGPGWPGELTAVFERSLVAQYASLTSSGRPVMTPVCPYVGDDRRTLDVSTGLTYPAKADRARGNPKVALLYADPVGQGMDDLPVVLVQGHGAVRDADLQANTDRYLRLSASKYPETVRGVPKAVLARMAYYYARIWIEVTPLRVRWWPSRRLESAGAEWRAPTGTVRPASDPPPAGVSPPPWRKPPADWRPAAEHALNRMVLCDLAVVGADGFPVCLPVEPGALDDATVVLRLGPGAPELTSGPACLSFHSHGETFTGQENRAFTGQLLAQPGGYRFVIERALGDWSAAGNRIQVAVGFAAKWPKLTRRLRAEAARRGQPVPRVRFRPPLQ